MAKNQKRGGVRLCAFVFIVYHFLVHCMSLIFTVYCPQNDGIAMFDKIAEKIEDILYVRPLASVHLCRDFNIHQREWFVHLSKTDEESRLLYSLQSEWI